MPASPTVPASPTETISQIEELLEGRVMRASLIVAYIEGLHAILGKVVQLDVFAIPGLVIDH